MDWETYLSFICQTIFSNDPQETDLFYKKNEAKILSIAKFLREKFPVKEGTIYRGLLLTPQDISAGMILKPLDFVKYLSFTEDKKVALDFADTTSDLATCVMQQNPSCKGYLIEHNVKLDEILYHHSWAEPIHLNVYFDHDSMRELNQQKEILLQQRMIPFKLHQVA